MECSKLKHSRPPIIHVAIGLAGVCIFYYWGMVFTRQRKVLAVVLGIAAAVFVADRVMGWIPVGPQQAKASAPLGISFDEEFGKQMRATAAMANLPPAPRTLADRLHDLADSEGLDGMSSPDAFCPAPSWVGQAKEPAPAPEVVQAPDAAQIRALQFRQHKLTATAVGSDGGMAIIDGQCITIGRDVDGLRLVSVDRGSATFQGNGIEVTLRLAKD